jgi:hypothetical protein
VTDRDGDALARALERLAAETRADDAAADRRRAGWLGRQAEEEATLAGVLVDLAERREAVALTTIAGRTHRGWVRAVGRDFVALRADVGADVLARFDGIVRIATRSRQAVVGDRALLLETDFATTVRSLGGLRLRVLVAAGSEAVVGELRWVGLDVAAVRLDGPGGLSYVPLATLTELCTVDDQLDRA